MPKDQIYLKPSPLNQNFEFNEAVVAVFDDMIRRSVPGYEMVLNVIALLAESVTTGDCYDLGCSLGTGALLMSANVPNKQSNVIGIDNSPAMIQQAQKNSLNQGLPIAYYCQDIIDSPIQNARLVLMNFTLQFIAIEQRLNILKKIRQGMLTGGQLLLSEKIAFTNTKTALFQEQLHYAFKQKNGYSALEISRKRNALENVLIPETIDTHQKRLLEAGFSRVEIWYQCFNFVSFIAEV